MVTETDQIAHALDEAAKHWPAEREAPGRLLLRLIEEGHRALRQQDEAETAVRRAAVTHTSGTLTGVYGDDYLARSREEWPA
jgi:hypothetical protein